MSEYWVEKQHRRLSIDSGRYDFKVTDLSLGWNRIGFALGTGHGSGIGGFEYRTDFDIKVFQCSEVKSITSGFEMHGAYGVPGLEETIRLLLLDNGALRVERRIHNSARVSHVVRSASCGSVGGTGGPVFTDNHIWRARCCHMDNVRSEQFPWCRPEYPYVHTLPKSDRVFGNQESQAVPAMILTNDTYSELLLEGQLRQDHTRLTWNLSAGTDRPVRTYQMNWSMPTGGFELAPGHDFELDPVYYQILENSHPQDCWNEYFQAVTAENALLPNDDILLTRAFYCSWNYGVFANISEDTLSGRAAFIARNMPDVTHFLIDGGWQRADSVHCPSCASFYVSEDQWFDSERFPNGMKAMADEIRCAGLKPAIWWTPAVALHSVLAREHPEWLAKDFSGNVYRIGESGYLDYSLAPVQNFLRKNFTILFKEWGYEAMKMDFWSQSVESEQIRYATGTGIHWRDWLLRTIRSYLPADGFLMTCVAVAMGNPFLGKAASTYRCSIDVGSCAWRDHVTSSIWNLPLLSIPGNRTCLLNIDGLGWSSDLSDEENLHRLTYGFITMGSLEIDGRVEDLPPEKIAILNRLTANMDRGYPVRCPDEAAFQGRPLPRSLYVDYPADSRTGRRGVAKHIALFNWEDTPQFIGFTAADLGLAGTVQGRNFWTDEIVTFVDGNLCELLGPRSSRLYEISSPIAPSSPGSAEEEATDGRKSCGHP